MINNLIFSVGIVQLTSTDMLEDNIKQCETYVAEAARQGASLICLPENAFFMRREARTAGDDTPRAPKVSMAEHPGVVAAQEWCKKFGVEIVIGSIACWESAQQAKPFNRSVVVKAAGQITAFYDKIHLFDVTLDDGESYMESALIEAGSQAKLAQVTGAALGLSICYDVRFPQLYRHLAQAGAQMLSVPAAFTVPTGTAHWHILLRARAIETGSFVMAAAQCGEHPGGRKSYGHSLLVSPWGEVLLDLGDAPGVAVVEINLADVANARRIIPNLKSAREY